MQLIDFAVSCGANLSVSGYFMNGRIVTDKEPATPATKPDPHKAREMDYNSFGVGISEVEIDVLTGID